MIDILIFTNVTLQTKKQQQIKILRFMEKTKITEERIQYDICSWFSNTYCLKFHNPRCFIFSVPNDTSDVRELMRKKSTGLKAGVSDLIVLLPKKVLFIEVKTEIGVQGEKQKEFENILINLGFEYHLVRSLDQFKQIINDTNRAHPNG